jgi:AcrR family transcriptional regulator
VTRAQVLDAADRVALADGIDGLTVRRISRELGVTAPALYRYFQSKELIVDEVIDGIIGRTELPGPEVGDWAERLRICYLSVHDQVAPYAGLAARMAHQMPRSPSAQRNKAFLDEVLGGAGLAPADANKITYAVFVYTWGHLLAAESARTIGGGHLDDEMSRQQFLWGLDHLLDSFRREFPSQAASVRKGKLREVSGARK